MSERGESVLVDDSEPWGYIWSACILTSLNAVFVK